MTRPPTWRRSTHSASANTCVELASAADRVLVRSSNRLADGVLSFTPDELAAFVAGCKAGEFDDLQGLG